MALALMLALGGCSQEEPPQKKTQAKPAPQKKADKKVAGPWVFAGLLLNNSPAPTLTPDLPLVLSCVIENPLKKGKLLLKELSGLKPVVRSSSGGQATALEWESPGLRDLTLDPGGSVILYWLARQALEPGDYRIGLDGLARALNTAEAGVAGVRVEQVVLKVKPGSADPKLKAYWQRRVLALKGDAAAWLAAVEAGLAKDPENHGLLLEQVDALAANQKPDQARQALADLIVNTEKKLRKKDSKRPVHLPYWYYAYQRRLTEEAAKNKTGAENPSAGR